MESADLLDQEPRGWDKLEKILGSFFRGALASLALYLFFVNTEGLWSLFVALDFNEETADLTAIVGSAVAGLLLTIFLESKKARTIDSEKLHYWLQAVIRYFLAYIFLAGLELSTRSRAWDSGEGFCGVSYVGWA